MFEKKSIHDLELSDFNEFPIWKIVDYDVDNDDEMLVEPLFNEGESINKLDTYMVRIKGDLADGTEIYGIGDVDFGKNKIFNFTFQLSKTNWEVLNLPPAPDFVLEESGPIPFAKKLSKSIQNVYPMKLSADIPNSLFKTNIEMFIKA
ncbi:hypothetical protein [Gottfriedia acidiceleris]|uniref:Uncharacterized protein n=1 Tax=Gottfriedia acidiceleris TaxID=371036 RepID=A0ABY4JR63_9BACI|nr:hypothetical protein [Gottfriedia acidiceleris]UPM56337.1 hypothetical protein MY490_11090 [Gottfriedia acidiceleris]